ncbi:MAG: uracil-DNA glycosylase [Acidobacteria bacterium]|nr:uracil-DNA glycosylase [Acidobacteriota bacterium]MBI3423867.1 uracil-DNA glycosylase [Acidobacteriota bacterium]
MNTALFDDLDAALYVEEVTVPADDSLAQILADVQQSQVCGACQNNWPLVFGEGDAKAELMLIGEGPGVDDAATGLPFQGQAGVLLNKMLAAINVARVECYVCNVIKRIPPGQRKFSVEEIEDCRPFLLRQILVVRPRLIVAFGALAAQTLIRSKKTISELRGRQFTLRLNAFEVPVLPTFNPAYLLRVAEKKREAWDDLKQVRALLKR